MTGAAAGTWASNADLAALAAWVKARRRIVILTHVKPDGDAVGSTLALARAINLARGSFPGRPAPATPWYWGPLPLSGTQSPWPSSCVPAPQLSSG